MSIKLTEKEYERWERFLNSYPNRNGIHTITPKKIDKK